MRWGQGTLIHLEQFSEFAQFTRVQVRNHPMNQLRREVSAHDSRLLRQRSHWFALPASFGKEPLTQQVIRYAYCVSTLCVVQFIHTELADLYSQKVICQFVYLGDLDQSGSFRWREWNKGGSMLVVLDKRDNARTKWNSSVLEVAVFEADLPAPQDGRVGQRLLTNMGLS